MQIISIAVIIVTYITAFFRKILRSIALSGLFGCSTGAKKYTDNDVKIIDPIEYVTVILVDMFLMRITKAK